jgi:hypothetical protein
MAGMSVVSPHRAAQLSAGTGVKTVFNGAARLKSVYVSAALIGTLTISGFKDEAGANANVVLPVGFVGTLDFHDSLVENGSLTAQKSSASDDGKVTVIFAPE